MKEKENDRVKSCVGYEEKRRRGWREKGREKLRIEKEKE